MRPRLAVAAILIAAIAVVFVVRTRRHSNPGPTAATATVPQHATPSNVPTQAQLQSDILRNGLTPEKAVLFFGMVVGPLPGVSVPDGSRDPSEFDGTLAVEYLYREWNALTDAQRRAARPLIEGPAAASGRASRSSHPLEPAVVLAAYAPPQPETPA